MTTKSRSEIIQRLRCAAGHLNAVVEMVEAEESCEQVLHQLNAVQAALRTAATKIIECQVESSQDVILNSSSATQRTMELQHLQSLYAILVKHYSNMSEVNYE